MYSVDFEEIEVLQHQNKWRELTDIMVNAAKKLKNGGADFIVICTNTMHKMASDIEKMVGIKVLHIAEVTGGKITQVKMKKVGLLETKFTMEQDFYKKVLKEKFNVDEVIYNELCK
jgi:aspartate racemase